MGSYDEDLFDNPFFVAVHKQYTELFNQAIAKKALVRDLSVLCVPKFSVCAHKSITKEDAEDHILLPDESVVEDENNSQTKTKTLSGKTVLISDGKVHTSSGFDHPQSVQVLFEETFHSENDNSYRVLCIGHFLNSSSDSVQLENAYSHQKPSSYEQCLDLLWNHSGGQRTRDNLDKLMNAFADVYDTLEVENLRSVMDMASAHFTKAMQHLLKDSFVRQSAKHSSAYMDSLKVAVETYMMNAVHVRLFCVITAAVAAEDAEINKMTRNLASLQLQDMGIRKIFSRNIPAAKKELATLNRFSTPLGRLFCMKRVVTALTRPLKHCGKTDHSTTMMTTDDFLPILIFLIIKSEIPNWTANLVYMRHFHFAKCTDDDEFGFYLASVEAALEHIKSGYISEDMKINKPIRERWSFLELTPSSSDSSNDSPVFQRQPSSSIIDEFFKCVQDGDEEAVKGLLQRPQRTSEELTIKLCHPLCSCDKCEKLLASSRSNSNLVTAYTRDNRGYTALHMAAYHGQGKLIDLLIQSGAVVDATDYLGLTPLHLACQRGFQNVMLLLLHFGADPMIKDNEGNTALHHCCLNGHEDCVKGLVFYDTSSSKLQVNGTNDIGDTALHMAAKWGYENIVKILLENGADATMKNRKHQSPIHMAQNMRVQRILQNAAEEFELQPFSAFNRSLPSATSLLGKVTRASSFSSGGRGRSGSSVTNSDEDFLASRIETASLDEAQDKQLKRRKDKLFKAILDGDIQLVKFYIGVDEKSDDEEPSKSNCWENMCHPLCQCDRCASIQKARVKAHQSLSVNVQTTSGYTPLHMAVLHHHNDLVDLFLQHGTSVNTQNHKKLTALHIAACLRNLPVVVKLLERGAKINIKDINGDTPLHISCANGFVEGVQALIMKGVDVNIINNNGNTPLHEAADHLQTGIIRVLLEAGADPTIRNKLTQTALNLAKDPQSEKVLQAAIADWQQKLPDQQLRKNSGRAAPSNQVRIQELFAAFEDEDLKTLQSLTASIRSFHQKGSLRQAVTHDKSRMFLTSIARSHSIRKFDLSTLRKVHSEDKSGPLHMYSLATEGKRTQQGAATSAGTETLVRADSVAEGDGASEEDAKSLMLSTKEGWVSYFNGSVDLEIPELSSLPQMLDDLTKTGVSVEVQVKSNLFLEDLDLCSKSESVDGSKDGKICTGFFL
ncbi:ankyrin repeat domain-containing protein 27-like isoform X1 [Pomacea canaliculata]|uniref:ankyrin repeat domain-containing protein 27-like isoform X1 n=1 Tax=Pomacea canaliculata TaxID=400727 RepID=UPI000D731E59|nr:ankyrin repeat domain-containing protein 27-like isoform X1 [Pomacea canaliculata]